MALTLTPTPPHDTLARELDWLAAVLDARLKQYFGLDDAGQAVDKLPAPKLPPTPTPAW